MVTLYTTCSNSDMGKVVEKLYKRNTSLIISYHLSGNFEKDSIQALSPADYDDKVSKKAIILALALFDDFREYANEIFKGNVTLMVEKVPSRSDYEYLSHERQFCSINFRGTEVLISLYLRNIGKIIRCNPIAYIFNMEWRLNQDYLDDIIFIGEVKRRLPDVLAYDPTSLVGTSLVYKHGSGRWKLY